MESTTRAVTTALYSRTFYSLMSISVSVSSTVKYQTLASIDCILLRQRSACVHIFHVRIFYFFCKMKTGCHRKNVHSPRRKRKQENMARCHFGAHFSLAIYHFPHERYYLEVCNEGILSALEVKVIFKWYQDLMTMSKSYRCIALLSRVYGVVYTTAGVKWG